MITPAENLAEISASFESRTPEEILQWALAHYHPRITMATAFGPEGCVLIAMIAAMDPGIRIFNLDTGYQFQETLELRDRILRRYGIAVEFVTPVESVEDMERRFGGPIYRTDPDECCRIRKVVPLQRRLQGYSAWITAIRRDQTAQRAAAGIIEWDTKFGLVKVNPLAAWSKSDVWRYITENDVPFNPLHDRGFTSIGCWPCTRAVGPEEPDRAGRWNGLTKIECGLHTR